MKIVYASLTMTVGSPFWLVTPTPTVSLFCRPDHRYFLPSVLSGKTCAAQNVRFFSDAQQAQAAGFRPCKRCQPDKNSAQQHRLDKIARACQLLEQESPLTLDELAQQVAMSPYHLHRLFKATTGMTPKAWQQSGVPAVCAMLWRKVFRLRRRFSTPDSPTAAAITAKRIRH